MNITNNDSSSLKQYLLSKYGPLMSLNQLAKMLDRSPESLRVSLSPSYSEESLPIWKLKLRDAKHKIGRRVHFRTDKIADFLSDSNQ